YLALGISVVTGIPIDTEAVLRIKNTDTQTKKTVYERSRNVDQIFVLRYPERFEGKHILIIDDVLTTGATTTACGSAFAEVTDMRISVLTLALAD
ncbi:MAG: ComF family protein, partial [Bacteroidales bacterium]